MAKGIIAGGSGSGGAVNPTAGIPRKVAVKLLASGWDAENSQIVDVLSLSADKNAQLVHVLPDNAELYADSGIVASVAEAGKMKFTAETVPEVDLDVMVVLEELGTQNPEAPDELVFVESGIPVVSDGSVPLDFDVWIDTQEEADPEEEGGGGVDIPAQDTEPEESLFWLDTSEQGGTYLNKSETEALVDEKIAEIEMPSGGVEMELIWENASPNSTFAAQTISLDLTDYDGVLIQTIRGTEQYNYPAGGDLLFVLKGYSFTVSTGLGHPSGNTYSRDFSVTESGVTTTSNGGSYVPIYIFGVKGVTNNV